jgi:hypothetical protein
MLLVVGWSYPTIGGDNRVSMGGYDFGVATLKYCYISAGSKG